MKLFIGIALFIFTASGCSESNAPSVPISSNKQVKTPADASEFLALMESAKKGDYQSQRNLAYGYASTPYPGQEKNMELACTWYLVIANSGNKNVVDADISNANVYCGSLEKYKLPTAKSNAERYISEIYGADRKVKETSRPTPMNLKEAIATARPHMADIHGNDIDTGAAALALWGADMMKWSELQGMPLGKYAMVMKDSDSQRGSRICTSGRIIEIAVDASVPGKKIYLGGMYDDAGKIYRFIAVHSTGEIVANSRAKFCGIITGQQHYQNSMGGVAHAVHLVGMFDLAENR